MSESRIELKDIYDDAILQGTVEGAEITKRCGAKVRMDGATELVVRGGACGTADRLAEKLDGDPKAAYAIACVLYNATVLYGKLGEEFLREKLHESGESFSLEEYCNAVAESVIRNYNGKRKQKVIDGVKAALSDADNTEANAAKAAILIHEYWHEKNFDAGAAVEEAFLKGETIGYMPLYEKMIQAKYGEIDEASVLKTLNTVYDDLKSRMTKSPELFSVYRQEVYPGISDEKLLVYYISKLGHEEVERVKDLFLKDIVKSDAYILEIDYYYEYLHTEKENDVIKNHDTKRYTLEEVIERKSFTAGSMRFEATVELHEDESFAGVGLYIEGKGRYMLSSNESLEILDTTKSYEKRDGYTRATFTLVTK